MNRHRIAQEDDYSVGKTILWSILTGVGLGIGLLLVDKISKKLERKYG